MTRPPRAPRLAFRALRPSDAPDIVRHISDDAVWPWLTRVPHPYATADAEAFIALFSDPAKRTWVVERDGAFVGVVSHGGELGYWIARPHWGRGYATEAATALLADHFAASDAPVPSGYHAGNDRSARVLAKLGFRPTGAVVETETARGDTVPIHKVVLSRADWEARA
ncbi:GNAT family N-acetyltransferase [Jannaschia sp. Os4]|uniref:GNAT family N-acetyltransferase n=1 Tax=Jannaschia sp. Os4 TaxID=2807617 RepID=UPI0019396590|nr:GNAT family N-acetyltransferase [Jannaschia sp. Os4]MBM2576532.1 GNAT family N-acetyltransferase [Jannaschia sp. Os4]